MPDCVESSSDQQSNNCYRVTQKHHKPVICQALRRILKARVGLHHVDGLKGNRVALRIQEVRIQGRML